LAGGASLNQKTNKEEQMRTQVKVAVGLAVALAASSAYPVMAQEKKAEKEKAKAQKVAGDIGLLDTEKNYMIVVTKEGKLVTLDYNAKTKVTAMVESKAKMSDIGLGSAASVQYTEKSGKNYMTAIEFIPAKGE
jgi:hypothetical protein